MVQIRAQQQSQRMELNGLAARIGAMKAERKVLRAGELETALRRSQELSGVLTTLAQSLAMAEGEAQKQNVALLNALSQALLETRQRYDALPASDRAGRRATLESMRKMRAERDRVSAQLPAALVPALDQRAPSDDPEDLLEQADLLRDNQDKVKRELAALERRIRDVREEHELDRRMNDFAADESMFDESDRRLRLTVPVPSGQGARGTAQGDNAEGSPASKGDSPAAVESAGAPSAPGGAAPITAPNPSSPSTSGGGPSVAPTAAESNPRSHATGQPFLGRSQGDFRIEAEELDDLGALEQQRKRLSGLANELGKRAKEMEARAKSLR
ncbi:MAG: TetR family transcriptional regulator [Myxococcaceae bacterium]